LSAAPQPVIGAGSAAAVAVSSSAYNLTLALPLFGCTVRVDDNLSAAERFQLALAHQQWLQTGRTVRNLVQFDLTGGALRLDVASGAAVLDLKSGDGGITMRGTAANAIAARAASPTAVVVTVSDASLEVTRGPNTFRCVERFGFSFTFTQG
jgi:hypothetical protein